MELFKELPCSLKKWQGWLWGSSKLILPPLIACNHLYKAAGSLGYHDLEDRGRWNRASWNATKLSILTEIPSSSLNKYSMNCYNALISLQSYEKVVLDHFCQFLMVSVEAFEDSCATILEVFLLLKVFLKRFFLNASRKSESCDFFFRHPGSPLREHFYRDAQCLWGQVKELDTHVTYFSHLQ